jgi:hypothetical protein
MPETEHYLPGFHELKAKHPTAIDRVEVEQRDQAWRPSDWFARVSGSGALALGPEAKKSDASPILPQHSGALAREGPGTSRSAKGRSLDRIC